MASVPGVGAGLSWVSGMASVPGVGAGLSRYYSFVPSRPSLLILRSCFVPGNTSFSAVKVRVCFSSPQKAIKEKDIPIEGLEFMGPSKGKTENSS
nr:PREDICTED: TP53-regulated inhibitor of apoptosis 1 [Struthio camelus australis]